MPVRRWQVVEGMPVSPSEEESPDVFNGSE